jgi:hypothetical protein
MDPIFGAIQQNLDSALSVPFVSSSVVLGLAFYAYKAAPELPSFMEEMFLNVFFQIFIGFLVLYMSTQNFMLSLVVSAVFVYGMKMLSNVKEGMFGNTINRINLAVEKIKKFPGNKVSWNDISDEYKHYGVEAVRSSVKAAGKTPVDFPEYEINRGQSYGLL